MSIVASLVEKIWRDLYAADEAAIEGRRLFERVQGDLRKTEAKDAKGHGSEKRSVLAPASHEEPSVLRSETPKQRKARIKSMKVDPARADVMRRALGMKKGKARETIVARNTPELLREGRVLARRIKLGLCGCSRCRSSRVVTVKREGSER